MRTIALFFLIQSVLYSNNEVLKPEFQELVKPLVTAISNNDVAVVSGMVQYPLKRKYPIPSIRNKKEFVERFVEIFDKNLISEIINSSVEKDWSSVGWRGIMLKRGMLWIDYDGNIIGINYESQYEQKHRALLIQEQKRQLYSDLKKFEEPILICETKKFKIRIDALEGQNYRYAVWSKEKKQSSKPNLVLTEGRLFPEGTGGNHYYQFINGRYKYIVYISILGHDDIPGKLKIYRSDKLILEQDIEELIR